MSDTNASTRTTSPTTSPRPTTPTRGATSKASAGGGSTPRRCALRGRVVVLGSGEVHGISLPDALRQIDAGLEVVVVGDLRKPPRAASCSMVVFDLPTRRPERTLADVRRHFPSSRLVALIGDATADLLGLLLRGGCDDYLVASAESALSTQLVEILQRAADDEQPLDVPSGTYRDFHDLGLIGRSRRIRDVFQLLRRAAASPVTVLITGESGTGKELVARAVHYLSDRREAAFVPVNCGALPKPLLESELFGHVRGAFSGAIEDKLGLLREAEGGTLFLDEICDLPLEMQVKMNRVLQERQVRRLGDTVERDVDVRFVAASNKDFEEEIRMGRFREDLFYRLNVLHVELPPLRERGRDVAHLAEHYLTQFSEREGKYMTGISPEAMKALLAYPWPGNVRELEHTIERAVLLSQGTELHLDDLPINVPGSSSRARGAGPDTALPYNDAMRQVYDGASKAYVEQVLARFDGNVSRAARHAGIPRESFHRILRRFGIRSADVKERASTRAG